MKPDIATQSLLQIAREYLDLMLIRPGSSLQWGLAAGLLVLVVGVVMTKMQSTLDAGRPASGNGLVMAILGPLLLLAAAAALTVYALPAIDGSTLRLAALIGGLVLTFLLIVVPLGKLLFQSQYLASLMACGVAFGCGAIAVLIVHLGFQAFSIGENAGGKIEQHNEAIKEE